MRVTFFNRSYWPDTGATGQLLTELAEDLAAHHGCEVTIVSGYPLRGQHALPAREVRNGVTIVRASGTRFDPRRFAARAANYLTYFASACVAALRLPRCDVVVSLTDPPIIGLAALLAVRRSRARFLFLCQDIFPEVAVLLEDFHSPIVNGLLNRLNRFLVRRADAIVALGDTMKRRLVEGKGADPAKIQVIHNWADCSVLLPHAKDNRFSRAHGLDRDFVVMHAGNIGLSQNLDVVLDAAERLRDRGDMRFVFIGDGARRPALERSARDRGLTNVSFLPYQPRVDMVDSYAAADVFIVSLEPGLAGYIVPSKLYSILASGRPYVAAVESECEAAQITREHECGLLVAPGDGQALADAILRLYSDRLLAATLGTRARATALLFDRPHQVAAHAAVMRQLVRARA